MLVKELIAKLQALHRPDAEVVIPRKSIECIFDDVTQVYPADCVYLLGNKPEEAFR